MSMIPVGSGEASEINSLEQQARAEYGPKKARKPKAPRVRKRPMPPKPPHTTHVAITPGGAAVHVHR